MVVALDNGCIYTKQNNIEGYDGLGKLCCLNLDTFELFSQGNIDQDKGKRN